MIGLNIPVGRVEPVLLLLEECFDLLEAFLVFGHIEILLDDSNEHV